MDDFLNQLREAPRPEFTKALQARLAEADRMMRRRAARVMALRGAGGAAAVLGLIIALNLRIPTLRPVQNSAVPVRPVVASALLLPVAETQAELPATSAAWLTVNMTLHASPAPISHHHVYKSEK